jgi:hypothetical protein
MKSVEESKDNWLKILDYTSDHSLLYTIKIIQEIK